MPIQLSCAADVLAKRPASRDLNGGAVRLTIICRRLSVSGEKIITFTCFEGLRPPGPGSERNPNKSSLYDVNRTGGSLGYANLFSSNDDVHSTPCRGNGGAGRDRTDDLLLAKQALSQLSYGP
jgi:hypothetical protein